MDLEFFNRFFGPGWSSAHQFVVMLPLPLLKFLPLSSKPLVLNNFGGFVLNDEAWHTTRNEIFVFPFNQVVLVQLLNDLHGVECLFLFYDMDLFGNLLIVSWWHGIKGEVSTTLRVLLRAKCCVLGIRSQVRIPVSKCMVFVLILRKLG